VGLTQKK